MGASQLRVEPGTLIIIDGVYHKLLSRDSAGMTLRTLGAQPVTITKSHVEIAELYFAVPRRLTIVWDETTGLPEGVRANLVRSIETFDVRWQNEALRRLDYVQACDRYFASRKFPKRPEGFTAIAKIVARARRMRAITIEGSHPSIVPLEKVGGTTLKVWYSRWRKSGGSLVALVPLHDLKGAAGFKLDPEVEAIIEQRVREDWLILEGPPLSHVIVFIENAIDAINEGRSEALVVPNGMTIRRWVKANISKFDEVYFRKGKKAAEDLFRHVRKAPQATRPLEIVEVDHTPLDVLAVDVDGSPKKGHDKDKRTKRVWLTVAICAATRMIVGFHISDERPSWTSVMNCLRMAVLPKDLQGLKVITSWPVFGVPEIVKLDNGKEFHSRSMKAAAGQLRFELRYMPRRKPHLKGKVERLIGTINRDFTAYLTGRTFRDVRERGDYDSVGRAAFTIPKLVELFTIWVVDIYHNRPHRGLFGRTPLGRWEDLSGFGVRVPPSREELSPLIALVVNRTIQRDGIHFLGLTYQSDALKGVRRRKGFHYGQEYLIKVDPTDITELLFLDEDIGEWDAVPCSDIALVDGISLPEWRDTVALARKMTAKGQQVARDTLKAASESLRREGWDAGAKPIAMTQTEINWFRDHVDDPWFDLAGDPSDEGAHDAERHRRRRPSKRPPVSSTPMNDRVAPAIGCNSDLILDEVHSEPEASDLCSTKSAVPAAQTDDEDPDNWTVE
jgi:putative transposase